MHSSQNIILAIKLKTRRWAGHMTLIGKIKLEGNDHLEDLGVDMRQILIWLVHKRIPFLYTNVCTMVVLVDV